MGKRIILLLDGTWNDSEAGHSDTNIVRLRELILNSLDRSSEAAVEHEKGSTDPIATQRTYTFGSGEKKIQQATVVYYDRGVGTGGFFDKYLGGALGAKLERNVRRAYRFLSATYCANDEIFIFGFSRGAYTARSLVGLIAAAGLLHAHACTPVNESKIWYYYRTNPKDRFSSTGQEIRYLVHKLSGPLIECLAVFDTVGARGIPIRWFWRENRDLFEFHDVELSSIARRNFQALAIDEHRQSFEAAIWRQPKMQNISSETEQVWFVGSHADIGGGYIDENKRAAKSSGDPEDRLKSLDDITLDWMVKKLLSRYPDFPINSTTPLGTDLDERWAIESKRHESRRLFYRLFPFVWRAIGNTSESFSISRRSYVCQDRHAEAIGERVHISALQRLDKRIAGISCYRPRNLMLAIKQIDKTYPPKSPAAEAVASLRPLLVVDWPGNVLSPSKDEDLTKVRKLIDPHLRGARRGQTEPPPAGNGGHG